MKTPWPAHPLVRNRYFHGMLMSEADFTAEQEYHRKKLQWHNRCLHGFGVACGLDVSCAGKTVRIGAGMAIDATGREIVVAEPFELEAPCEGRGAYLVIRYAERETTPMPVIVGDGCEREPAECSRIEEGFALAYEPTDPRRGSAKDGSLPAVALARFTNARGRWRLDRKFRRPRTR